MEDGIKHVIESLVLCNNVEALIAYVKGNRQLENEHLKVGIDSGTGFLEVCLSVVSQLNIYL